jgi:hypothetical protein
MYCNTNRIFVVVRQGLGVIIQWGYVYPALELGGPFLKASKDRKWRSVMEGKTPKEQQEILAKIRKIMFSST